MWYSGTLTGKVIALSDVRGKTHDNNQLITLSVSVKSYAYSFLNKFTQGAERMEVSDILQ